MIQRGFVGIAVFVFGLAACSSSGGGDGEAVGDTGVGDAPASSTTSTSAAIDEAAEGADCLVGEWMADIPTFLEGFGGFLERVEGPELGGITGSLTVSYDGSDFVASFDGWTVTLVLPGGAGETVVTTDGDQSGPYSVTDGVIAVTDLESSLDISGSQTIGGVTTDIDDLPFDIDAFAQTNLFATPVPFECSGDELVYEVVTPELDESFTENMTRIV